MKIPKRVHEDLFSSDDDVSIDLDNVETRSKVCNGNTHGDTNNSSSSCIKEQPTENIPKPMFVSSDNLSGNTSKLITKESVIGSNTL